MECKPHRRFKLWIYDLRTNKHFTLKENPLKRTDLDDFVACYNPKNRHERKESARFKSFDYEELTKRDKPSLPYEVPGFPRHAQSLDASRRKAGTLPALSLDIFWLKDEGLEDSANLPDPDIIAQEIVEDLQAALAQLKFTRYPHLLTASLAALPSMSLIPFAPFAEIASELKR